MANWLYLSVPVSLSACQGVASRHLCSALTPVAVCVAVFGIAYCCVRLALRIIALPRAWRREEGGRADCVPLSLCHCQYILPTGRMADAAARDGSTQLRMVVAAELAAVRSQRRAAARKLEAAVRKLEAAPPEKQAMFQKLYDDLVRTEKRLDAKHSMLLRALLLGELPGIPSSFCQQPAANVPHGSVRVLGPTAAHPAVPPCDVPATNTWVVARSSGVAAE